ncbi:MAG: hypothetical protein IRY93_12010, partial [Chthoniobacterales bacterium]|nr:hypothetical protein [Chthoniobacterales bacterium]
LLAYDLYLRGKKLIDGISFSTRAREELFEAVQLLEQAVARDPFFYMAYSQLAGAHDRIYFLGFDHTDARLKLAENAIDTVRRLRPDSGELHLALAQHAYWAYADYDRARQELAIAQKTLPNESRIPLLAAYIARRQGHWEESLQQLQHALSLDPRNFYILQQVSITYEGLHRYKEMAATLDKVLNIAPKDVFSRVRRAWVDMEWRADLQPLQDAVESILSDDPDATPLIAVEAMTLGLRARNPSEAERALAAMPSTGCHDTNIPFPNSWCEGLVARLKGDDETARRHFLDARKELEQIVRAEPQYSAGLCALGVVDAALGDREEAIRQGERAVTLTPINGSGFDGSKLIEYLAVIYAWTGEKDRAIARLSEALQLPGDVSYGYLRLDPIWDPLRGDPRFEALVASLAPKEEDSKR